MKVFDVCNDYSLKTTENEPILGTVRWVKALAVIRGEKVSVELGYSRKHNELIYLKGDSKLENGIVKEVSFNY